MALISDQFINRYSYCLFVAKDAATEAAIRAATENKKDD